MPELNRVLILAQEPMVSALVGLLVELTGRNPVFADHGEGLSDALLRLRPLAVVLIDASVDAAQSDIFFAVTGRHEAGVAVFGSERDARSIAEIAATRSIPWFTLPPTADELAAALSVASGDGAEPDARTHDRRRVTDAIVASDGTRILRDGVGRRWMVYDRRTGADRRAAVSDPEGVTTRVFVSDTGERRECGVSAAELAEGSVLALETQLARATR